MDDVRFRRILGLSETVNSWSWPTAPALQLVDATLNNRLTRLNVEISALSERAEVTARRVEELADLKRQATIAEATYRVMIEQVKAQTLSAGYQPNNFKVYHATAPVTPSAPKRNLILALGWFRGLFWVCDGACLWHAPRRPLRAQWTFGTNQRGNVPQNA